MDRTINVGGCEMQLRANAATPIYYRNVFQDDFVAHLNKEEPGEVRTEVLMRLMFVESMQATVEHKEMRKQGEDQFIIWLTRFEWPDLVDAAGEALNLWMGQSETLSESKNAEAEEAEG